MADEVPVTVVVAVGPAVTVVVLPATLERLSLVVPLNQKSCPTLMISSRRLTWLPQHHRRLLLRPRQQLWPLLITQMPMETTPRDFVSAEGRLTSTPPADIHSDTDKVADDTVVEVAEEDYSARVEAAS